MAKRLFLGLFVLFMLLIPSLARMETPGFSISGKIIFHNKTGNLFIEVVNEAEFNKKKDSVYQQKIGIGTAGIREVPFRFDGIPKGIYAIQCFQDVNGDSKLDRDIIGRPTEPWGCIVLLDLLFLQGRLNSKKSPLNLIKTLQISN